MTTPTERIQALKLTNEFSDWSIAISSIADAQFEKLLKGLVEILGDKRKNADYFEPPELLIRDCILRGIDLGLELVLSLLQDALEVPNES